MGRRCPVVAKTGYRKTPWRFDYDRLRLSASPATTASKLYRACEIPCGPRGGKLGAV
jgi:hypothetical protein